MTQSTNDQTLIAHRDQIDSIDQQLLSLLNQRASHAKAIGEIKNQYGETGMYRPEREAQVLSKHMENNPGPIPNHEIARIFREIMSLCLSLEKPLDIAYLGPEKTFTEMATLKHFGGSALTQPKVSITEVFRSVESGNCDFGVVPVENSTEGAVNLTLDCFVMSPLLICGETELRIHQNLISSQITPKDIEVIYAHPQSLAQCRRWIERHIPHAECIACNSNTDAIVKAKESTRGSAAIASREAAIFYEVPILAKHIEDDPSNTTRFLILGPKKNLPSGNDKTSFLVSADDRPGLLAQLIEPLSTYNVTMTRIESRPSKNSMWGYIFFMDVLGHQDEAHVQKALGEIKARSSLFKILGSYPIAQY